MLGGLTLTCGVGLMAVPIAMWGQTNVAYGAAAAGFVVGMLLGGLLAKLIRSITHPLGHVADCAAVGSMQDDAIEGETAGHLHFGNPYFARAWQRWNPE